MCSIGNLFKLGLLGLVISWIALFIRYGEFANIDAKKYQLPSRPSLSGPLAANRKLEEASYLLKGEIQGPESIVVEGEHIYASLYDGRVVRITDGKVDKSISFTKNKICGTFDSEPICGRPLGMRRLNQKELVVADAYLGIYAVDTEKGSFRQLLKSAVPVEGRSLRFLNDVEVLSEDEILFSDSSSKWDRRHYMNILLEQANDGAIYRHRLSTGETSLLVSGLSFPNGIQLLADKKSFVFAECGRASIRRYNLESGEVTSFAENLPGLPDNIRMAKDGSLWVGMAGVREKEGSSFLDMMGGYPGIRQFLVDVVPGKFWLRFGSKVKPPHSMIVQLDQQGKIISSMHDVTGKVIQDVSQVTPANGQLYLGSFHSDFIAVVKL